MHPSDQEKRPSIVTPGNHDGVHMGHRALIMEARRQATLSGYMTRGLCFDPHPTSILAPERAPTLITKMEHRLNIMKEAGCDDVVVLPFNREFAQTEPEVFAREILVERCNAKGVVIGPDFHFGKKRSGNVDTLREFGQQWGFSVTVVAPILMRDKPVSSTRIRQTLSQEGDVASVAKMMTRVHDVTANVVKGDQRGRTIGFPTANLEMDALQIPADGVYAVVGRRIDQNGCPRRLGVANIGSRPTFGAGRSVEVHFLDAEDGLDLYDARLRIGFVQRLRDEQPFDSVDALVAQLNRDCDDGREAIASVDPQILRWV